MLSTRFERAFDRSGVLFLLVIGLMTAGGVGPAGPLTPGPAPCSPGGRPTLNRPLKKDNDHVPARFERGFDRSGVFFLLALGLLTAGGGALLGV